MKELTLTGKLYSGQGLYANLHDFKTCITFDLFGIQDGVLSILVFSSLSFK